MNHLPITQFRRLTLILIAVVMAGLAMSSIAAAEDFRIDNSTYRVEVTGQYIRDWHGQTTGYPESSKPWSTETGKVTAGFHMPGVRFRGSKFFGDLPGTTPLPKFQFMPLSLTSSKSRNRASFKRKINYVPSCGGELGECTGDEKAGVEATSRSCSRPNSKIPIEFKYDQSGHKPDIQIGFGSHRSLEDFCGRNFPGYSTIDQLKPFRLQGGLDLISAMSKGQTIRRERTRERGYIGGDGNPKGSRYLDACPNMSGIGTRICWTIDLKLEVKRIR